MPDLKSMYLVVTVSSHGSYGVHLECDRYSKFREAHDSLVRKTLQSTDENMQGILSKVRGYMARIAMIIHCLELAIADVDQKNGVQRSLYVQWRLQLLLSIISIDRDS